MSDIVLTKPTACIVSGYRLPEFIFYDTFSYAIVFKKNVTEYEIACSSSPITIGTNDDGDYTIKMGNPHQFYYYNSKSDTSWRKGSIYNFDSSYYMTNYQNPIWSTHKVVYPDNSVFIDKSNSPSALYEGNTEIDNFEIDLYSWTVGLAFGLADGLGLIDNSMYEEDDYG